MKFLIDAQLPPGLARILVSSGHSAEHVFETGGLGAKDEDIWTYAKQTGSTIITKDEDFAVKVCMRSEGPAVVWVRIGNSSNRFLGSWQTLSTDAGTVTGVSATTPLSSSGGTSPTVSLPRADGTTDGYLAGTDWATFNSKVDSALPAGQVIVGDGSNVATGVPLSGDATISSAGAMTLTSTGTAGTYTKVTTDTKGRVTVGDTLVAGDIPNLDAAKITSGVLDAARIPAGTDSGKLALTGGTMSGSVDMGGNNVTNAGTIAASTVTASGIGQISTGLITPKIYPPSDSTTAFQINKANGTTTVLNVDTTNGYVGIGTTAPVANLNVAGTFNATGAATLSSITTSGNLTLNSGALNLGHTYHYIKRVGTENIYYSSGYHGIMGPHGLIAEFVVSDLFRPT